MGCFVIPRAGVTPVGPARSWPSHERAWRHALRVAALVILACAPSVADEPAGSGRAGAPPPVRSAEIEALRAATLERVKGFTAPAALQVPGGITEPARTDASPAGDSASPLSKPAVAPSPAPAPASQKPIERLLEQRLHLLDEYQAAAARLEAITQASASPERQAASAAAELRRLDHLLSQAAADPDTLLPPIFRGHAIDGSRTLPVEMKSALESTSEDVKKWRLALETQTNLVEKWSAEQARLSADRDSLFHALANWNAKREAYESAVTDAPSSQARMLAKERLVNFEWESRVQSLKLQVAEAELAAGARLADVRALELQIDRANIQIGMKTLERMQSHYRAAALAQESELKQKAAIEERKALDSSDPLEHYRAQRAAELLKLETLVLKYEQVQATNPSPSVEEQATLADHADDDFARIRKLVEDGNVSRLDAVRLNNEFRRIGPERDRLVKNELATVEAQIQYYENLLTSVELDLMQGGLHDLERDLVRERLPQSRWSEGDAVLLALEKRNRGLLVRERDALESLANRAGHTLQQVLRRMDILDREYGFIRTSIFWVRDQEPIGVATLAQQAREFRALVKGLLRLARESVDLALWARPTAEFVAVAVLALALPFVLIRIRTALGSLARL